MPKTLAELEGDVQLARSVRKVAAEGLERARKALQAAEQYSRETAKRLDEATAALWDYHLNKNKGDGNAQN
jgi:hypothetical protein